MLEVDKFQKSALAKLERQKNQNQTFQLKSKSLTRNQETLEYGSSLKTGGGSEKQPPSPGHTLHNSGDLGKKLNNVVPCIQNTQVFLPVHQFGSDCWGTFELFPSVRSLVSPEFPIDSEFCFILLCHKYCTGLTFTRKIQCLFISDSTWHPVLL